MNSVNYVYCSYPVRTKSFNKPLEQIVEADETFIGGREKNKHYKDRVEGTQGRSTKTKTPVFGMVERGGDVRAMKVTDTKGSTLKPIIEKHVSKEATVVTDEWLGYRGLEKHYKGHLVVNHSENQYVVGAAHTNTIESFWSLLKRGIIGIYHKVSVKHLDSYLNEFQFRFNSRDMTEGNRLDKMLSDIEGPLKYKTLISKEVEPLPF